MKILHLLNENYIIESFPIAAQQFYKEAPKAEVDNVIGSFRKLLPRASGAEKDIRYWQKQGFDKLKAYVVGMEGSTSKRQNNAIVKSKEAVQILSNDKAIAVVPLTERASIKYGKGTEWCTAASKSYNYFKEYFSAGVILVYLLCKDGSKYACAIKPNDDIDLFDSEDNTINYAEIEEATGIPFNELLSRVDSNRGAIDAARLEYGKEEDAGIRHRIGNPNGLLYKLIRHYVLIELTLTREDRIAWLERNSLTLNDNDLYVMTDTERSPPVSGKLAIKWLLRYLDAGDIGKYNDKAKVERFTELAARTILHIMREDFPSNTKSENIRGWRKHVASVETSNVLVRKISEFMESEQ